MYENKGDPAMKFFTCMKAKTLLILGSAFCIYPMHGTEQKAEAQENKRQEEKRSKEAQQQERLTSTELSQTAQTVPQTTTAQPTVLQIPSSSQQTILQTPFTSHQMLIFLDDSEYGIKTIGKEFMLALMQKACPILFSGSLMQRLVQGTAKEPAYKLKAAQAKFSQIKTLREENLALLRKLLAMQSLENPQNLQATIAQALNKEIQLSDDLKEYIDDLDETTMQFLINQQSFLDPDDWMCKRINDFLYILIPGEYIQKMNKKYQPLYENISLKPYFPIELALGLHLQKFPLVNLNNFITHFLQYKRPTATANKYLVPNLHDIFIPKEAYAKIFDRAVVPLVMPQWAIYITGHGTPEEKEATQAEPKATVVGLSITDFQLLLDFLENNLVTKLFAYASCYAAGINAQLIYKTQNTLSKTYSYAIASMGLVDVSVIGLLWKLPLYAFKAEDINLTRKNFNIRTSINFRSFVDRVSSPISEKNNFAEMLLPIMPELSHDIQSYAQLKLPGLSWFNVIDSKKKLAIIGSVLANSRTAPMTLSTFFKRKEILGILLYARIIQFPLIIDTQKMPAIISMIPGDTLHELDALKTELDIRDIIQGFNAVEDLASHKIFYIKSMTCRNVGKMSHQRFLQDFPEGLITIKEVIIDLKDRRYQREGETSPSIYFTFEGKRYESIQNRQPEAWVTDLEYEELYRGKAGKFAQDVDLMQERKKRAKIQKIESLYKDLKQRELKHKQLKEQAERASQEEQKEEKQNV